jgi:TolB protein
MASRFGWRKMTVVPMAAAAVALLLLALSEAFAASASPPGIIVYVGTDSNIYYCSGNCGEPQCITCKGEGAHVMRQRETGIMRAAFDLAQAEHPEESRIEYGWPTFSPDGRQIAYSSISEKPDESTYAVWVYDIKSHQSTQVFESRSQRIVYVDWLDDGRHLSFLLGEPQGLSLILAEVKEGAPVRIVTTGMPLYFDWSPSANQVAVHTIGLNSDRTEQVSLISVTPSSQHVDKVLSSGRTPFKTPCWSPDHKHFAYIATFHAETNLLVADADGKNARSIVSLPVGENSFIWSPDSAHIAYSTAITSDEPVFHGIRVVDMNANSKIVTKDDVAAFFFAPDGKSIAYIGVPADKPYYTWNVVETDGSKNRKLMNFLSTPDEATAYRFFDQLAVSHSIWAPDSSAFVYAGVPLAGEPGPATGLAPPPMVWIVPADGSKPRAVEQGVLAFYAPPLSK